MTRTLVAFALLLISASPMIKAQQSSLPGCETPPAVRKIIKDQLHGPAFDHLAYAAQVERNQQVLSGLIERYPREVEPYKLWIDAAREDRLVHPERLAGIQKEYRDRATAHPDDPLALYIAANALQGTDTPETIRLLDHAQSLAPSFPWPALDLADMYSSGKFADKAKFTEHVTKFWNICPTSQNSYARWMLVKVPELQARVAKAERAALLKEKDPERLKDYEFLWGLEFRTTSPQKFPELRQQVAEDVKRLEHVKNPHPDAAWADLLIKGSKQAGAAPDAIHTREDALLAAYPHSGEAQNIAWQRWKAAHPEPTDAKDVAAWKSYNAAHEALQLDWIKQYPDATFPPATTRFSAMWNDDSVSEQQGIEMAEKAADAMAANYPPSFQAYSYSQPAGYLLDHKWAPEKALDYLQQAKQWQDRTEADYRAQDNHSESDLKDHTKSTADMARYDDNQFLLAALRAHRSDAISAAMKASIEAPRAADDKNETGYWLQRARLASVEGQQQDALGYYQLALRTRSKPPSYQQGRLRDELGDEAHALWKERGGTEVAWAAFSQPDTSPSAAKAEDARWEKPTKTLPRLRACRPLRQDLVGEIPERQGRAHQSVGDLVRSLQCGTAAVTKTL